MCLYTSEGDTGTTSTSMLYITLYEDDERGRVRREGGEERGREGEGRRDGGRE